MCNAIGAPIRGRHAKPGLNRHGRVGQHSPRPSRNRNHRHFAGREAIAVNSARVLDLPEFDLPAPKPAKSKKSKPRGSVRAASRGRCR